MADPRADQATDQVSDQDQENQDQENIMPPEIADNPAMRAAAIRMNPSLSLEEGRNATAGEAPNAAGGPDGSVIEDYVPSNSDPNPTNLASTDHPLPDDAEDSNEETLGASSSQADEYNH
ncbi:MAG: hypothetical protein ACKO7W_01140 [Elainella sp.]